MLKLLCFVFTPVCILPSDYLSNTLLSKCLTTRLEDAFNTARIKNSTHFIYSF